jgi:serine/threonine-protein kinase RsbW
VTDETPEPSSVHLELESQAESVALVRAMLAGVAELLDFEGELLDELNTTVSEACNNVVRHAYGGDVGPLIVHLTASDDGVEVSVRDHGIGLQNPGTGVAANPQTDATDADPQSDGTDLQADWTDADLEPSADPMLDDEPGGVGIPLISALADRSEFLTHPDGGTEVRIGFSRGRSEPGEDWHAPADAETAAPLAGAGDVVGTLAPVNLLGGVVGRMGRLLAARSRFSLERFSDLYLLFDQLAFHATRRARKPAITFSLSAETRRLEVELAPIAPGRDGFSRNEWEEPPANLRVLADELTVEPVDDGLRLRVVVGDADSRAES